MLLDSFIIRKPRNTRPAAGRANEPRVRSTRVRSPREQLRRRIEGILFGS